MHMCITFLIQESPISIATGFPLHKYSNYVYIWAHKSQTCGLL